MTYYILVSGGVMSGLGKGITTASLGCLLKSKGYSVTAIKIDPYLNYDAGTMRPTEHGEVWVTEDGGEIDQDLGHYERFLNQSIPKEQNLTTGKVYGKVIEKERAGEYLGKTVEVIPHVTDEIKRRIREAAKKTGAEMVLVEVGGTVGEYQNMIYFEAARQMKLEGEKILFVHLGYLPIPSHLGEMKTKPTQTSIKELGNIGIQPDFIVGRAEQPLDDVRKEKIALFSNLKKEDVISNPDLESIYELPMIFEQQNFSARILEKFGLKPKKTDMEQWKKVVDMMKNARKKVRIGIVGKYFDTGAFKLTDSYVSVIEAVKHAAAWNSLKPDIVWIDSKDYEKDKERLNELKGMDGIIVPGGFGSSGVEGKILAIEFARKNNTPFLGLCYGLQLSVIEFARNVCGMSDANSTEIDPKTNYPVIDILPEQKQILKDGKYGATMRLGGQTVKVKEGTMAYRLYGKSEVVERFRHRYEVNPQYVEQLEQEGLVFSGTTPDKKIMQIIEIPSHKFFLATQFHPEFTSRFM
ncbi:MAG: CTP synthase, partial [Candidatus Aenigmatarchaeota archaeon]